MKTPEMLSVLLTNKCNLSCNYCEFNCTKRGKFLSIDLLEKILKQGKKLGIRHVVYDGGEPMIHPKLNDILKVSSELGYNMSFVTNAWFIEEKFHLLQKYNIRYWIGLDGLDASTHDGIRGHGSFDRVMRAVDILKSKNMFVAINFLVLKENYMHVEKLLKFAQQKKIDAMQIIPLNRFVGRALKNKLTCLAQEEENHVRNALLNNKVDCVSSVYFGNERIIGDCKYLNNDQVSIDWDGSIQLCALTPEIDLDLPSLKNTTLNKALEKLDVLNKRFVHERHSEAQFWEPDETNTCGYCLEKLRVGLEDKSMYKELDGDLLLTTSCPVQCDFCVYSCDLYGEWMPIDTIRRVAEEYTKNNVGIRISGGEPFMDKKKLSECLDIVLEYQRPHEILVITSGFFATSEESAREHLEILEKRGLDSLVVSYDRFHDVPTSNLINIKKATNMRIIVRLTTDLDSQDLMDEMASLIVEHDLIYEPHHEFGHMGKGELLDKSLNDGTKEREEEFRKKVIHNAQVLGKPTVLGIYERQSPKRSQRAYASRFYPTTFPNGNIYGDSQCMKGTFMGNINKSSLKDLMTKFKRTLAGRNLLSDAKDCTVMDNFGCDTCDYCRNQPFDLEQSEAIGRNFVVIQDITNIEKAKVDRKRENLLSIRLNKDELSRETGKKILSFLESLDTKGIRYKLSRPLPRCVLSPQDSEEHSFPKNCQQCAELFTYNNGFIDCRGQKMPDIKSRNNITLNNQTPSDKCKKCVFYVRKSCYGFC